MRILFSTLGISLLLSACGGSGSNSSSPSGDISLDESGVTVLVEGQMASLNPAGGDTSNSGVVAWRWSADPINEGALAVCSSVEGFELQNAARRLQAACTDPTQCSFSFDQGVTETGATKFDVAVPVLQAPIGLTYQLEAVNSANQTTTANFTFCLLSINEPPVATDDTFTAIEGSALDISSSLEVNLLSNDTDDADSANLPLSVNPTAVVNPTRASEFSLKTDGGFTYLFIGAADIPAGQSIQDSFVYEISDGTSLSTATAIINIVTVDKPPIANGEIPPLQYDVGEEIEFDLSAFFTDPEGSELVFVVNGSTLPPSGELTLTSTGMLVGNTETNDAGSYVVSFTVSDQVSTGESVSEPLNASVSIEILPNEAPVSSSIANLEVEFGTLINIDMSQYFEDEDPLVYSLSTVPATTLQINPETGLVTGQIAVANDYEVTVSVNDGFNPDVSESFILTQLPSPNSAPVLQTPVANVSVTVNEVMEPFALDFVDPDGDVLTYEINAEPPGVEFDSATGIVSGTPSLVGIYRIRIRATDPEGLFLLSDVFQLQVNDVPNVAPVPTIVIADQEVEILTPMTPVSAGFEDTDVLSYSIAPALAAASGFVFDFDTGVLSGTPRQEGATTFTITASDGVSTVDSNEFTITVVPAAVVNTAPIPGAAIGAQVVAVGDTVAISGGFTDAEQPTLSYTITPAVPVASGLSFSPTTGVLSGDAAAPMAETRFVIIASDGFLQTRMAFTLEITPLVVNTPPIAGTPPLGDQAFTVGEVVSISGGFTDMEQTTLSYTIAPAVPVVTGLTFSATDGTLSGTAAAPLAQRSFTITASDGELETPMVFTLAIAPLVVNTAPIAGPPLPAQIFTVEDEVSISGGFTDMEQPVLSYTIAPAVPARTGLVFSATDGTLSGTAATPLPQRSFTITASDGDLEATMPFTLTILPLVVNTAPMAGPPLPAQTVLVGAPVLISGGFTDMEQTTLSYTIAPVVPVATGLTFSATDGILSGTAAAPLVETTYVITASDGELDASISFTLTILEPAADTTQGNGPGDEIGSTG